MAKSYIYVLSDPITGEDKYVGQSVNPKARLSMHMSDRSGVRRYRWIAELRSRGHIPTMRIVEETDQEISNGREKWWIDHLSKNGAVLLNSRWFNRRWSGKIDGAGVISMRPTDRDLENIARIRELAPHLTSDAAAIRYALAICCAGLENAARSPVTPPPPAAPARAGKRQRGRGTK